MVRAHVRAQGRPPPRERGDRLAPRAHPPRPLRGLARQQRGLGALARPVLGHADPRVALRGLRPRHVRRIRLRARRARGPGPRRARPAPPVRRRRDHRLRRLRGAGPTRRARARRVVRLGIDARRAVALPVRAPGDLRATLPRRLHLRGDRPDARVVLLAPRGEHARVREVPVPRRRLPVAPAGSGRSEDVQEPRQRDRSVDGGEHPRRRCAALELRVRELPLDPQARPPRQHRRDHQPLPRDAVEHLRVLRHLREPRRLGTRRAGRRGPGCPPAARASGRT